MFGFTNPFYVLLVRAQAAYLLPSRTSKASYLKDQL